MLTAEQRYRQAVQKTRLMQKRYVRQLLAGEDVPALPCGDLERKIIIAEIERAMREPRRDQC